MLEHLEERLVPTTYEVGPGLALTTIGAVPWNNLQAGDAVNIHWQANPYHEKIILSNSGTAAQHIVINGVAGPQGQLPILDAANATSSPHSPQFGYTPNEDLGLIIIFRDSTKPYAYQPSYIDINNLQLQGANAGTSFTGYSGDSRTYSQGAGGIWTEGAANLTIHNCTITNNTNGVFAKSNGDDNTYHITLDSNYIYGNGLVGSDQFHGSYIEAYGATYQYNRYGPPKAGAGGNALKDRSSSTIIRYNFIQDGGHLLDLVEPQDGYSYISTDPNYLRTLVYGNILVSDPNGPLLLVHYGDGALVGNYRNGGVLYFYNNTIVSIADQTSAWGAASYRYGTILFQMEVNTVTVDARNNIFYNAPEHAGANPSIPFLGQAAGNVNFATTNWMSPGWLLTYAGYQGQSYNGTITGTNNFVIDPSNNPGFANLATYDAHLLSGSGAIGKSGALASAVASSYPVTSQYVYNQASQPRSTASDLGAFAYAGGTSNSASSLTLGTSVTSSTAGSGFTITVTAKDGSGNTATGYIGTVHFTSSDALAVLPADYTFTASDAGVHTFNVTLKTAGSDTITVGDTSSSSLTGTASVTVNPAAAKLLSLSGFPTSVIAGTAGIITVKAKDAYGNGATAYAGTVHFTSSDPQAVLPADYTFVSSDLGVHSFSVTLLTPGSASITATDNTTATITGTETGITVSASVSQLVLSGFPGSTTAGVGGTVTVAAEDALGNVVKGYTGTVHFTSSDTQAGLPADYTFVSADNGVHSFSITLKTAGTQSLTATDKTSATITGTQSNITVAAAAASKFSVSGFPTAATAGTAASATVTAQDPYGNVSKSYTGTVHFTSSDSQAGLPADYTFVSADNGVHSFSATLKTAGTQSITAADTTTSTIKGTQSGITVAAAAASKLAVSGFPASATAGTSATLSVTAQDAYGNVAKSYTGSVHFTSTDSQAALPADYTFVSADNGAHSFSVTLKTAGAQSLTATDKTTATITGTQSGISVAAAAASKLVVSGFPASATAGAAGTVTATAQDAYGNVAKSYTGTVHFTSTDSQAGLPPDYTFVSGDNGVHSFSVTLKSAGTQSLTATDKTTATITGTESGISVAAAAARKLVVSGLPTSIMAGVAGTMTVTADDAFGNVVAGYAGTVHFTSTDVQASLPANYTFVSADKGSHSFSVTLKTAGSQSVTATDQSNASLSGSQSGISVTAAVAQLVVSGFPTAATAGVAGTVTATAQDAYGNVVQSYTGTVHFTSTDSQAGLPADYTFVGGDNGAHSFSVTLKTAGTQSITAADTTTSTIKGTQSGITVAAAAASKLAVSGFPASATAGTSGTVSVTAQDAYGNVAKSYTGTVHFTSSDAQATLPADYTFVSADNGAHSFSITLKTAGAQSLTATDKTTATITGTQSGISVAAAAASKLVVSGFPTAATAGIAGTVSATAQDAYGNVAKSYTGTVHFTSSDAQAGLPADYTFVSGDNGVHSFSVTLKSAGTQSLTATDKTTATITGTESGISVAAAAASKLVVSGFPTAATAGVAGTVSVTAQDAYGNVAKSYTGTVHFTSSDARASLPADYTFVSADNGAHAFSVTLKSAGTQSLTATDKTTATITGTESGISVAVAAASTFVVSGLPTSIMAGVAATMTVTADDAFGNVATGYAGTVHFTSTDTQASLPANYTFVSADKGSHSFSLTLRTAGSQSVTATDQNNASLTGSQSGISVTPAAAQLLVSGFPTSATAGTTATITVAAKDNFGNLATAYTGTVHFSSTDAQAVLPADYQFVSADQGSHAFRITLKTAGSRSVTATDKGNASLTGTESGIAVSPGSASQVTFTAPSLTAVAGTVISPAIKVQVFDSFGNLVSGDNSDSVTVTVASGPGSFTSGSTTSVTVSGGVASFGNLALSHAGSDTISASTPGLITAAATVHVARTGPPPSYLTAVANNTTHSAEYYTLIVNAAYQRYLGRLPDSTGLASWVGQMQRGLTDEYLEAGFIGSPEYIQTHGGAGAGWITGMYQNLLGRNPWPAEVTTWLQALANGESTTNIAYGFAASPEREGQIVSADYQQYLGRTPTAAEVSSWVTVFENGSDTNENVVGGFAGSTEYFHNHFRNASDWYAAAYQAILGLPATQAGAVPSFLPAVANTLTHSAEYYTGIVTAAYQRYLGRTPDSAGLASWVGQMQQGVSDEHLEAAFIGSKEFIQNHGGLGAGWITAMYQSLLGRTPSQAEINQWLQALANGVSTTTIAYAFAAGPEREGQRVAADYQQYLGRTPTAAEVASWVNDFESGAVTNENVVAGFVGSVEYFQKYNGDAQHWWNQAVQALFGASGF
jgi:hypothetical protein